MIILKGKAKEKAVELKEKGKEKGQSVDKSLIKSKFSGLWKKVSGLKDTDPEVVQAEAEMNDSEFQPPDMNAGRRKTGEFDDL